MQDPGRRIARISEQFLGTADLESTLRGDEHTAEDLVINLCGVDCFTLLDYVEAMRRSCSFAEFAAALKQVRYKSGKVSFMTRNHFFTDWAYHNAAFVEEITVQIGSGRVQRVRKTLNLRDDGSFFIDGIEPMTRTNTYIPSRALDESVILSLKTGDYAGIYSDMEGLDVSHVGILIAEGGSILLRHASSVRQKVADEDFITYLSDKPGFTIFRPMPASRIDPAK